MKLLFLLSYPLTTMRRIRLSIRNFRPRLLRLSTLFRRWTRIHPLLLDNIRFYILAIFKTGRSEWWCWRSPLGRWGRGTIHTKVTWCWQPRWSWRWCVDSSSTARCSLAGYGSGNAWSSGVDSGKREVSVVATISFPSNKKHEQLMYLCRL